MIGYGKVNQEIHLKLVLMLELAWSRIALHQAERRTKQGRTRPASPASIPFALLRNTETVFSGPNKS